MSNNFKRTIYLHLWVIILSAFVISNKVKGPYPQALIYALNRPQWSLVHALSSMLFGGTIVLSTLMEYIVITCKKTSVIKFWFTSVPQYLDSKVVLVALTGAIVSGVGQAALAYGGLATSPKHVIGSFHLLTTFGLWWGITDVTTQKKAMEAVQNLEVEGDDGDDGVVEVPKVLKVRVLSNVVSCLFVVAMYALMVLKPGIGS
eukprot:g7739.t1 g7739   contig26:166239-166847(+)